MIIGTLHDDTPDDALSEFTDREHFEAYFESEFAFTGFPTAALRQFAHAFNSATEDRSYSDHGIESSKLRKHWVIRNDDLKLLDAITDALKAAAGAAFFMELANQTQVISACVAILVAATKLIRQRKKGAWVSGDEIRVLLLLKANGCGLRVSEIAAILHRAAPPTTDDDVRKALARLSKHAVADGTVVSFVAEDEAGLWRAADV